MTSFPKYISKAEREQRRVIRQTFNKVIHFGYLITLCTDTVPRNTLCSKECLMDTIMHHLSLPCVAQVYDPFGQHIGNIWVSLSGVDDYSDRLGEVLD